jgi:hypothetical protein
VNIEPTENSSVQHRLIGFVQTIAMYGIAMLEVAVLVMAILVVTGEASAEGFANQSNPVKDWWEKRNEQRDLFFPHNAHREVLKENGDSCLLCHAFTKNNLTDPQQLDQLTAITNEPLQAVCHSCHVQERTAPWRCALCHSQKQDIWPDDHNGNYLRHHSEDARQNEPVCRTCHLDLSFCTDCHFRRQPRGGEFHPLGYIGRHGLEVRMNAADCGRCHNPSYCSDCHRSRR